MSHLNTIGWINGLTALFVVICAGLFGLLMAVQSRKKESNLLLFGGLMGFFAGMLWLGPTVDFLSVILTGQNLPSELVYGALTFMWILPLIICAMYVGAELMLSEQKTKRYLLLIFSSILGIIFELKPRGA
ncbi:MAG: hypothetical protein ACTSQQ_13460 [Candidatus Helarchaeota archaeon]